MALAKGAGEVAGKGPTAALEMVVGVFQDLQKALTGVVNAVAPFVEAFAPAIMQDFNAALKDLQATIGSALAPVVQVMASVTREVSGVLLPVLQKLTPVFTTLANAAGTVLVALVRVGASLAEALMPVVIGLATYFAEMSKLVADVLAVFAAVARVLGVLTGSSAEGIQNTIKAFVDGLRQAVTAIIRFAAQLGTFFGFKDTVRAVGDALAKEAKDREDRAAGLKAAATNPQFIDVAAISKNLQLAAFNAQGDAAVRDKPDSAYLKELAEEVRKIAGSDDTIRKQLNDWWEQTVGKSFLGDVSRFFISIADRIRRFLPA